MSGGSVESCTLGRITRTRGKAQRTPAAFFDLDGTLVPEPSLERRLMRFLYWRGEWTPWKFARWVRRYLKVCALSSGISREPRWVLATHGNKTYWKNVRVASAAEFGGRGPRIEFFAEGVRRIRWHASQGHKIFLVSGTLEILAHFAAERLQEISREDALRSEALPGEAFPEGIGVCATRLAESAGRWTGEVPGEPMWGMAKARAIERLTREHGLDLKHSFAYANSANDHAMLTTVAHPMAVNPTRGLRRIAEVRGWPITSWKEQERMIEKKAERRPETLRVASRDSAPAGLPGRRG
jgi:phosphoserine phosphatase